MSYFRPYQTLLLLVSVFSLMLILFFSPFLYPVYPTSIVISYEIIVLNIFTRLLFKYICNYFHLQD